MVDIYQQYQVENKVARDQRDGSAVNCIGCSSRGPEHTKKDINDNNYGYQKCQENRWPETYFFQCILSLALVSFHFQTEPWHAVLAVLEFAMQVSMVLLNDMLPHSLGHLNLAPSLWHRLVTFRRCGGIIRGNMLLGAGSEISKVMSISSSFCFLLAVPE